MGRGFRRLKTDSMVSNHIEYLSLKSYRERNVVILCNAMASKPETLCKDEQII